MLLGACVFVFAWGRREASGEIRKEEVEATTPGFWAAKSNLLPGKQSVPASPPPAFRLCGLEAGDSTHLGREAGTLLVGRCPEPPFPYL